MVNFHTPEALTKELQIQHVASTGQRRIRLSTNFLGNFGFLPGTRLTARHCSRGFDLVPSTQANSPWKVHLRRYAHRRNNPTESIIDIQGNDFINKVVPCNVERLHFTLLQNQILVRPVYAPLFHIRQRMQNCTEKGLCSFLALSSGLDAVAFAKAGFSIQAVLDWRPPEVRDAADLTETGLCTVLANHKPRLVFNEDITRVDMRRLAGKLRTIGDVAMLGIGLQCDDFSSAKSASHKRAERAEFRPSSRELGFYATRLIDEVRPATVLIENVPGWHQSEAQAILGAVLTRIGYYVQAKVLNAADFGALTRRVRCYLVASCWPGYEFPEPTARNLVPLKEILKEEALLFQDVGHTRTIAAAKASDRARFCPLESTTAPTVLKSQARRTKDSLYFTDDAGRILFPTVTALKTLHGFGEELNLGAVSSEVATEQIGQGIDLALHQRAAEQLHKHIWLNCRTARQGNPAS